MSATTVVPTPGKSSKVLEIFPRFKFSFVRKKILFNYWPSSLPTFGNAPLKVLEKSWNFVQLKEWKSRTSSHFQGSQWADTTFTFIWFTGFPRLCPQSLEYPTSSHQAITITLHFQTSSKDTLLPVSLSCHLASVHQCALILFIQTLALYKSYTYLPTFIHSVSPLWVWLS